MKKLLLLLLLSLGFIGNAFAVGAYKCTPEQAYAVTDEGILQNDKEKYPMYFYPTQKIKSLLLIEKRVGF